MLNGCDVTCRLTYEPTNMLSAAELSQHLRSCAETLIESLTPVLAAPEGFDSKAIFACIESAQSRCLSDLAGTTLWGKDNQLPSSEFWQIAGSTVERGPLQWHARAKPHGYSGDFEMLHRIANNLLSQGKLEQEFDRFFQKQSAPHAVRSRTRLVAEAIKETVASTRSTVRVASVGSGPAADVRLALSELSTQERARLKITLLDLDPYALEFAKSRIQEYNANEELISYERVNLFRLPRNRHLTESLSDTNLVFCTGLFDYLEDHDAVQMLRCLNSLTSQDGRLMVFNFEKDNPSRAYMEWFGNWYLIYRNQEDLNRLARTASLPPWKIRADGTGYNLYIDRQR